MRLFVCTSLVTCAFVRLVCARVQLRGSLPTASEFGSECVTAARGLVYRCLTFNLFMGGAPVEARKRQLGTLFTRTLAALQDFGVPSSLSLPASE